MSRHPKDPRPAPPSVETLIRRHSQARVRVQSTKDIGGLVLVRQDVINAMVRKYAK